VIKMSRDPDYDVLDKKTVQEVLIEMEIFPKKRKETTIRKHSVTKIKFVRPGFVGFQMPRSGIL
jgi:hypothetical protein